MGDETWYDGSPYIMDIKPYNEDYFNCDLADIKPEEQEEHNYWTILLAEHKSLTKDYSKLTLLNRMYKEVEYNVSNKRILLLFEVKLLIELNMIDNTEAIKLLKMCKSTDTDNLYLATVILMKYTKNRIETEGPANIAENIRSKKYNNCSAIYLDNVVELFNLTT